MYGIQLTEEKLNDFRDEQIGQLKELMDEATKPNKEITISKDSERKSWKVLKDVLTHMEAFWNFLFHLDLNVVSVQ